MNADLARFKEFTEIVLPEIARREHWPLRFDHCFKRVCLDNACGGVWYDYIRKPAEKHITAEQLLRANELAEAIANEGQPRLQELNKNSLRWRSKL